MVFGDGGTGICLAMRDEFGLIPHVYFDWTEGIHPELQLCRYWLTLPGEGS